MGITPVVFAFFLGSLIGITAATPAGARQRDHAHHRRVLRLPSVLLAIALSGTLGPGVTNSLISLTVVFIPPIARVARLTTQIRNRDFVDAAQRCRALHHRARPRAGNVLDRSSCTPALIMSMILASGLSFLGLGVSRRSRSGA